LIKPLVRVYFFKLEEEEGTALLLHLLVLFAKKAFFDLLVKEGKVPLRQVGPSP
jgi:hypothetical protein